MNYNETVLTDEHSAADIGEERQAHKIEQARAGIEAVIDILRELVDKLDGSLT